MAETEFVLNYLKKQIVDNEDIFGAIRDDVSNLLQEVDYLGAFFRDANRKQDMNETMKHFFRELRRIVNQAENLIDNFVIVAKLHQKKGKVLRIFDVSHLVKFKHCSTEIGDIMAKLKEIRRDAAFSLSTSIPYDEVSKQTGRQKVKTPPLMEDSEVVGFDEEACKLIDRLCEGSTDLEFIPIVGMPGLGKTTLANKIFKSPKVQHTFPVCIWVYISQSYRKRDIFLQIISRFIGDTTMYQNEKEEVLADVVREQLKSSPYLIVLDDIWSFDAFDDIRIVLPIGRKYRRRVLLTTRDSSLAFYCSDRPHELKFLTVDECWELLQKKVFPRGGCPPDLEELGKRIASTCSGLPLATLVIAGALASTGRTRSEWQRVYQSVGKLMNGRETPMIMELLHMSYDCLPFNLKVCFLYCGIFPRGYDISARKIVLLWIAEGFIVDLERSTLETVAEEYLNALASKSLLIVTRKTSAGQIKTFRLHDLLHEFCALEASEENLFKEIKPGFDRSFPKKQELATFRRLCIDSSSVEEFISTKPYGEGVRSFVCFSSRKTTMPQDGFETSFPLLRVLDIEKILFHRFSKQFFQLYHLRYIALSSESLKVLPRLIEELWNLQTLIILTQETVVHIKADICSMPQLRHFYTNASAKLLPSAAVKTANKNGVLQTVSTIEPESCTEKMSARCQKLKKLGIRGEISELDGLLSNVNRLEYLENLKIMNDHLAGRELHLPSEIFLSRLKQLTLSNTRLGWNNMRRLASLEALEVLKLKENAFIGEHWETKDYVFPFLEVLCIERSGLVSWDASNESFPRLKKLVLRSLDNLGELPAELANICTLQTIRLENPTTKTVESARRIKDDSVCTGFNLSVFPPIP